MLNEKYALQYKVSEINSLADKIYDHIIEVSNDLEDGLSDLNDELFDEGSVLVYKEKVTGLLKYSIMIYVYILDYDLNQTGGYIPDTGAIKLYFSLPQFNSKKNNYNRDRFRKTLLHELTHANDYFIDYYNHKVSHQYTHNNLSYDDRSIIENSNKGIFDLLYRLWNDSELNAQQITITDDLVKQLKDTISYLKTVSLDSGLFGAIKRALSYNKYYNRKHDYMSWSDYKFKKWFITNSEKRLESLLYRKRKNDFLLDSSYD